MQVLDNGRGQGVQHDCPRGTWSLLGANRGGHELWAGSCGAHVLIAQHRSADHKCTTVTCSTADTLTHAAIPGSGPADAPLCGWAAEGETVTADAARVTCQDCQAASVTA